MSTRGAYGFKCKNKKKVIFSFSDSYFKHLGIILVDFIKNTDKTRLKNKINKLTPISKKSSLADTKYWEDQEKVLKNIYLGVYTQYYEAGAFLENDLFCAYYYLIDLDDNKFHIYLMGESFLLKSYDLKNIPNTWLEECEAAAKASEKQRSEYLTKAGSKNPV